MNHDVIWRVQRFTVVLVGNYSDAAIVLVTDHAPSAVFTGKLAAFEIESVSVAVTRGTAKSADVIVLLNKAQLPVVGNIAPQQIASLSAPGRTLGPLCTGVVPVDDRVEYLVRGETLVECNE